MTSLILTGGIGLAGASGAVTRYLLGRFFAERVNARFPLGTFLINISGAFLIGLVFALAGHQLISPTIQLLLATGFLGGYTTFSTLNWETLQLARGGSMYLGLLYLGGTFVLGLGAEMLGMMVGGLLR